MNAVEEAAKRMRTKAGTAEGRFFAQLLKQLSCGGRLNLNRVGKLNRGALSLALQVIEEWWLIRHEAAPKTQALLRTAAVGDSRKVH